MSDWREHNGGPQPVADDVWIGVWTPPGLDWWDIETMPAKEIDWNLKFQWCVLNEYLNDAAIKRGIELGLAAAAKVVANIDFCAEAILDLDPEDIIKENKND